MSGNTHTVYAEDMKDEVMNHALSAAHTAFETPPQDPGTPIYNLIAKKIREEFDKEYGRGWNCVVGRHFGAYVTHEIKTYIYFSVVPRVSILLWKSSGPPVA